MILREHDHDAVVQCPGADTAVLADAIPTSSLHRPQVPQSVLKLASQTIRRRGEQHLQYAPG